LGTSGRVRKVGTSGRLGLVELVVLNLPGVGNLREGKKGWNLREIGLGGVGGVKPPGGLEPPGG